MEETLLKCPYCGYEGEPCDFPDLFYDWEYAEQYQYLLDLQSLGYNIVTCGMCGDVLIQKL